MSLRDFLLHLIKKHFPPPRRAGRVVTPMELEKDKLGRKGEQIAARFLRRNGYKILEKNVRYNDGELDIVARDGSFLVFVEVKTRRDDKFSHPSQAVNREKQEKIKKLARRYATRHHDSASIRFDVIAIIWPEGKSPRLEHMKDAFR